MPHMWKPMGGGCQVCARTRWVGSQQTMISRRGPPASWRGQTRDSRSDTSGSAAYMAIAEREERRTISPIATWRDDTTRLTVRSQRCDRTTRRNQRLSRTRVESQADQEAGTRTATAGYLGVSVSNETSIRAVYQAESIMHIPRGSAVST